MLFNSYSFIFLFLPVTLAGLFLVGRLSRSLAVAWLVLASLVFYGIWNPKFVLLLLFSIAFNYCIAKSIAYLQPHPRAAKFLVFAGVVSNLFLLGYYKYFNFFVEISLGFVGRGSTLAEIVLPLGISFYTFTQIAFLVDVSRGLVREQSFIRYVLFVTYFPHLIAGPVLHHAQMMPQFLSPRFCHVDVKNIALGMTIFVFGLTKKIFFADPFGEIANPVFDASSAGTPITFFAAWIGALAYALQLYFDFSGYSDMAIGLSLMMNIRLPLNFNSPYKAKNIIEFWRRWHITLSTFLRDYLYIPLGGGRRGPIRRYLNILITMLLGGLWHGAGLTFLIWGGLHGVFLVINHGWHWLGKVLNWNNGHWSSGKFGCFVTFVVVVFSWVFFRADDIDSALLITSTMLGLQGVSLPATLFPIIDGNWFHLDESIIQFNGVFPHGFFVQSNIEICGQIGVGLFWIWVLPNTHEIMWKYKTVCEDLSLTHKSDRPSSMSWARRYLAWRLSPIRGLFVGMIFFAIILALASDKPTQFLYYQF
jgi:alginate O-acetyltransferase complex protein AlgI